MTMLLDKAIQAVQQLPADKQDAIASLIFEELSDDQKWDDSFAKSQDALAKLASKVRADIRSGKTKNTGIGEL